MSETININGHNIGPGNPVYIIAEMSANHNQDIEQAFDILRAAKDAGADAVKLQTYKPETITIDCSNEYFQIKGSIWDGRNLFQLYGEAYTPWEWHPDLKAAADKLEIDFFSSPFDPTAVEMLESMDVPAYKVASFEMIDLGLLKTIAQTGKPIIMSTGMATLSEIDEAVQTVREAGCSELALLKCSSTYPAPPEEMNLQTIPHLQKAFGVPVGLSDHTLGTAVPIAAVSLGARIIEKHFTLSRETEGPDNKFSLEPNEFKEMVDSVRLVESALGDVHYGTSESEVLSVVMRRSLFVVEDVKAGQKFSKYNVRSIRPGHGLHTRYLDEVIGRSAVVDIDKGTPLSWDLLVGR